MVPLNSIKTTKENTLIKYSNRSDNTNLLINSDDIIYKDKHGFTPLIHAKTLPEFKALIETGISVNSIDKFGFTPIIHSLIHNNIEQTKLLIEKGANIHIKDNDGNTPLIHSIFLNNNIEQTKLLIENGADVNVKNKFGMTPIFFAKTPDQLNLLIETGAKINITDFFCIKNTSIQKLKILWNNYWI